MGSSVITHFMLSLNTSQSSRPSEMTFWSPLLAVPMRCCEYPVGLPEIWCEPPNTPLGSQPHYAVLPASGIQRSLIHNNSGTTMDMRVHKPFCEFSKTSHPSVGYKDGFTNKLLQLACENYAVDWPSSFPPLTSYHTVQVHYPPQGLGLFFFLAWNVLLLDFFLGFSIISSVATQLSPLQGHCDHSI